MTPKGRKVTYVDFVAFLLLWLKRIALLAVPVINGALCLVFYRHAKLLLPQSSALAAFWLLFLLGLGLKSKVGLRIIKTILEALLTNLP